MMRGFPRFEECARPGLEPRVCAARAAHPMSVGCGFYFLRLLNHSRVINRRISAGGSARIARYAHSVHAALWSALQFISAVIVLFFFWIDLFVWSLGVLFLIGVVLWEVSPWVVEP